MVNMYMVSLVMFMVGNMIFISQHKHLLVVLLSLEFIVLSLFLLMTSFCPRLRPR